MALLLEWEWQRGAEQSLLPVAPGSPAGWVRVWCARPFRELLLAFCGN